MIRKFVLVITTTGINSSDKRREEHDPLNQLSSLFDEYLTWKHCSLQYIYRGSLEFGFFLKCKAAKMIYDLQLQNLLRQKLKMQ